MKRDKHIYTSVIWDFGGVLVRTLDRHGRTRWEQKLGLPQHRLMELVFNGEMGRKASLGLATSDDVWNWVFDRINVSPEAGEELKRDFWKGDQLDEDLITFIRNLRPEYKTGLLSNAWPDLREALENTWHIADVFDEIVISAEVGIVKPDPRSYQLIVERLNTTPDRAIFVDDFTENVEGAREIGMRAIHFKEPTQALRELEALLKG